MKSAPSIDIRRCAHRKTNGIPCGSPALKDKPYCYFHDRNREQRVEIIDGAPMSQMIEADLPVLEDANAIQASLTKVFHMLAGGLLDPKFAKSLIYCLAIATQNLPKCDFSPKDEELGDNAPARADQSTPMAPPSVDRPKKDEWNRSPNEKEDAEWLMKHQAEGCPTTGCPTSGAVPDVGTAGGHDFSGAVNDPANAVIPNGLSPEESASLTNCHPERSTPMAQPSPREVEGPCVSSQETAAPVVGGHDFSRAASAPSPDVIPNGLSREESAAPNDPETKPVPTTVDLQAVADPKYCRRPSEPLDLHASRTDYLPPITTPRTYRSSRPKLSPSPKKPPVRYLNLFDLLARRRKEYEEDQKTAADLAAKKNAKSTPRYATRTPR
jgi:hypothetical protein